MTYGADHNHHDQKGNAKHRPQIESDVDLEIAFVRSVNTNRRLRLSSGAQQAEHIVGNRPEADDVE